MFNFNIDSNCIRAFLTCYISSQEDRDHKNREIYDSCHLAGIILVCVSAAVRHEDQENKRSYLLLWRLITFIWPGNSCQTLYGNYVCGAIRFAIACHLRVLLVRRVQDLDSACAHRLSFKMLIIAHYAGCHYTFLFFFIFFKLKNTCVEFHKEDLASDQLASSSAMLRQQ